MFKLIDKNTYATREENNDFYIGVSATKNSILDENMNDCSDNYYLLYLPLERYCKSSIIFHNFVFWSLLLILGVYIPVIVLIPSFLNSLK